MKFSFELDKLKIEFCFWEQVWAVRFNKFWEIPLANIEGATSKEPQSNWREIKAPGSFMPGVIKAGTYYTNRGKEFWYVTKDSNYLTVEFKNESYKRMIVNLDDNEIWVERINQRIAAQTG
ncbi:MULTISPECIES: hypothetical protein [Kamptonema]|uniref:hypothetical protein n=1 Tax=Kamptonema TaxID=1501433 RepID=UPI0001DACA76|nr:MULTISPECIES: hypothetical protein [Kamptonema]CBN54461.1 conserved hypothetical protein [Kamptonema sp. PCC 6506]